MATTWTIAIDWERNGNFTGLYDDVTSRVISANWFLGIRQVYQSIADDGMLNLVLRNDDKRFSPEYGSSPLAGELLPFRPVIIQSNDGATIRTHFKGWIEKIQPTVDIHDKRTVEILVAGSMQFMKAAETNLALQENQRTDQIIAELLKQVVFPPALAGAFIVGVSRLGIDTFLADTSTYSQLDEGITTLTMAGDNWVQNGGASNEKDTFNIYQAIQDVVEAERGRFLFDRAGKALFWNRHHLIVATASAATFNDTMQSLEYVYGAPDELKNEVIVVCHPRTLSATSNEILWELESEIRVPQGSSRTLVARYRDASGNRIGGKSVTVDDETFTEGTGTVTITPKANSAELLITNTGSGTAVLVGCTIRGQKITDFGRLEAKAIDDLSITHYGRRTLRLNLPAVDNFNDAQSIAQFELNRRKNPRGSVRQMQLVSHGLNGGGHHANQLVLTLGSKITIQETQTGHTSDYHIIGEAHRLSKSGTLWETQWYLEPVTMGFWVLGTATLGENTVLAY